jgi:thiamine biosynthesis lipoprotein ApbE
VVTESSAIGDAFSTIPILVGAERAQRLMGQVPGLKGLVMILDTGELVQYGDFDFILTED